MRKLGSVLPGVVAVVLYGLAVYVFQPSTDTQAVAGSSTSANAVGSLAVTRLWGAMGLPFTTWQQVPALLPDDSSATFVSVEADDSNYTSKDRAALLHWSRQGHSVVWVSSADALDNGGHIHTAPWHAHVVHTVLVTNVHGTVMETLSNLAFTPTVELVGSGLQTASTLFRTPDGHVLGASFAVGTGRVTDWVVPGVWENGGIGTGDNLLIAWKLTGGHSVLWDEYGHGVIAQSMLGTVFSGARKYALYLLMAAALLFVWYGGVRFGRPVPGEDERTRLGTEFTEALTWHFRQPRLRGSAVKWMERAVWRKLGTRLGISPDAPPAAFERALSGRGEPAVVERFRTWRTAAEGVTQGGRKGRKAFNEATRSLLQVVQGDDRTTQSDNRRGESH